MLNQATMDMLTAMKLTAMAAEFANQLKDPTFNELGFEERLGLLVNAEWNRRQSGVVKKSLATNCQESFELETFHRVRVFASERR